MIWALGAVLKPLLVSRPRNIFHNTKLRSKPFLSEIEHFGSQMTPERSVKNHKLFEGVSPSLAQGFTPCCDLAK